MRALILALMLALTASSAFAASKSKDLDTPPDWVRQPDPAGLWAFMPAGAIERGRSGAAVIECEITPQGTLEQCKVLSEKPEGAGFGQAALLAAPSFAMRPALKDGKPVASKVRIPLRFSNPEIGFGYHDVTNKLAVLSDPTWDAAPSFADMAAAWPKRANGDAGHVSMRCGIAPEGGLKSCHVVAETPTGDGFGAAALALSSKFRLRLPPGAFEGLKKAIVTVPVHFNNPAMNTPRAVAEPAWITGPDPAKVQAIYPPKAADAGVKSGKGFADCAVAADGHLVDCKPAGAAPDGMGFAEAAVAVASIMQMNPWTNGGGPVDGVRIRLPIAFNLAPEPEPAKP